MRQSTYYLVICLLAILIASHADDSYEKKKSELLREEALLMIGGNLTLTAKEELVNQCIMKYKYQEIDEGYENPHLFNFSQHFFHYKPSLKYSKVHDIIKRLPKGAALHMHDMGVLPPDYLMGITYQPNVYICCTNGSTMMKFAGSTQALPKSCSCKWTKLSDIRHKVRNVTEFDQRLRKLFTMVVDNPRVTYPTVEESWKAFNKYFTVVEPLVTFRPVWERYFYDTLKACREEGLSYVEIRSVLPELYELDGKKYAPFITAKIYQKIIRQFKKDFPDFLGARFIYAPVRNVNRKEMAKNLDLAVQIQKEMPESFAGFDIVGQEDGFGPLVEFIPEFQAQAKNLHFFFHAGETNWYGTRSDANMMDAILLDTKRMGHGYGLIKHPALMREIIEKDIAIEVNVISNTILSLVEDVRNHPLCHYIANGMPVVISSDDPGVWEADIISDDYYATFVGAASKYADLRLIKALAMNSLKYSAMEEDEKNAALDHFAAEWKNFTDTFYCN